MRLADNRISEGLNSPAILGTFCGRKSVIWSIGARPGWTGHPSGARAGPHRPQQHGWVPIPSMVLAGCPGRRDPPHRCDRVDVHGPRSSTGTLSPRMPLGTPVLGGIDGLTPLGGQAGPTGRPGVYIVNKIIFNKYGYALR